MRSIYMAWKERMEIRGTIYQRLNALWETNYWEDRGLASDRWTDTTTGKDQQIRVEVNRIRGFVTSYLGSLFPQKLAAKVGPAEDGAGNHRKANRVANRWLRHRKTEKRCIDWMRQAIIYEGSHLKIRVDNERNKLRERVRMEVVPWWEVIVDRDVRDEDAQRYIAHVYQIPRARAVRRFADPNLRGSAWRDPIASINLNVAMNRSAHETDPSRENFVTVVEWYNYADDYIVGETDPLTHRPLDVPAPVYYPGSNKPIRIQGRYEVYLPDEPGGWERPREIRPMPFVDSDGDYLRPLHTLIFLHKPGFPLWALSIAESMYDVFREMILLRSMRANSVKRNARQLFLPKKWITQAMEDLFSRGVDGAILPYEQPEDDDRSIGQVLASANLGNLPSDHSLYQAELDSDLNQGSLQAPFTRGIATGVSATEVNKLDSYSVTEIGLMAMSRDIALAEVIHHVLVAHVEVLRAAGPLAKMTVTLRGEPVPVVAADLDADFEIEIKTGAATQAELDAQRQRLIAVMPVLATLLAGVEKGNPAAVILLDEFVDLFELPDELRSRVLLEKIHEAQATLEAKAQPGAGSAMPGGGSAPSPAGMVNGAGGAAGPTPMPAGPQPEATMNGSAQNGSGAPLSVEAQ